MVEKDLHPFVYWAQNNKEIYLRIDLKDVKSPALDVQDHTIDFKSVGVGNQGKNHYTFQLELMHAVSPEETTMEVTDFNVKVKLIKQKVQFWDRLFYDQKPQWLKFDFNKFNEKEEIEDRDERDFPQIFNRGNSALQTKVSLASYRKKYLALYNITAWLFFVFILLRIFMHYLFKNEEGFKGAYYLVESPMAAVLLLQFLEILHCLVGFTAGSVLEPAIQTGGRAAIFFCLIVAETRMQKMPIVGYLLLVWSLGEVVRYPYYICQVLGKPIGFITYLRYSVWILLYPCGFMLEGVLILRSIPFVEETGRFTLSLPNRFNWAFHFPTLLRIYLLFFFMPIMYRMMNHMYKIRKRKLA